MQYILTIWADKLGRRKRSFGNGIYTDELQSGIGDHRFISCSDIQRDDTLYTTFLFESDSSSEELTRVIKLSLADTEGVKAISVAPFHVRASKEVREWK